MGFTEAFVPRVGGLHHIQKDRIGWQRCWERDTNAAHKREWWRYSDSTWRSWWEFTAALVPGAVGLQLSNHKQTPQKTPKKSAVFLFVSMGSQYARTVTSGIRCQARKHSPQSNVCVRVMNTASPLKHILPCHPILPSVTNLKWQQQQHQMNHTLPLPSRKSLPPPDRYLIQQSTMGWIVEYGWGLLKDLNQQTNPTSKP